MSVVLAVLCDGLAGGGGEQTCTQTTDTAQVLAFGTAVGYIVDIALQLWRAHVADDGVYVMNAAAYRWVKRVRARRDMQAKVGRLAIHVRTFVVYSRANVNCAAR